MRILQQCFRVYTDPQGLDALVEFYEALQHVACERRVLIEQTGVTAAKVGGFLILSGTEQQLAPARHVDAIFYVDDLDDCATWLRTSGAVIVHEPRTVTGGLNLTARHADGLVAEYFEARS